MRFAGRQDDHLPGVQKVRLTGYRYFRSTIEDLDQGIEGRRMLTQSLTLSKGKDGDRSCGFFDNFLADYRAILISNHLLHVQYLSHISYLPADNN